MDELQRTEGQRGRRDGRSYSRSCRRVSVLGCLLLPVVTPHSAHGAGAAGDRYPDRRTCPDYRAARATVQCRYSAATIRCKSTGAAKYRSWVLSSGYGLNYTVDIP